MMLRAKNKLGLVFFPAFDWAISETHPEREERLLYTQDQIFEEGIEDIDGIQFFNPFMAEEKDILRVHFPIPDVQSRVTESHLIAAGGAIRAGEAVLKGDVDKSFALVRPPGHHAFKVVYGDRGFCIVNIEAVMVEYLRDKFGPLKVAIIDTDAHHGDGTEDIYWNDPNTLFISFHQDGRTLFPGTGFIEDFGGPNAFGYNINIPLAPETGEEGFLHVLDHVVLPILDDFKPDIIINSAGQDNHYTDPLTNMNFTAQGYAKLNEKLNPDIAILQGGYSIEGALPYVNTGIILAMAGLDYSEVIEPDYEPMKLRQSYDVTMYTEKISREIMKRWKNRETLKKKNIGSKDLIQKKRQIYYDTDGILETQTQNYPVCHDCSGYFFIDSKNDRGNHILGITIPLDACRNCTDRAKQLFQRAKKENYEQVILQDRPEDAYHLGK